MEMKLGKQLIFISLILLFLLYSAMVYTTGTSYTKGNISYSTKAKEGKLLFSQYNCIACHQIYGLGGYMGPDLTNSLSKSTNGEAIARAYLQAGTKKMPDFKLHNEEIDALIAFLKYLDQASTYPITNFEITYMGTVEEKDNK